MATSSVYAPAKKLKAGRGWLDSTMPSAAIALVPSST